ncbi:divisome-associated lipoprotein YraP [Pasteurella canis]|uniref:Putative transport-associated protein n=1 Tax=Pasteurella canis TaxID=753 RepID=A0A379ETY8_9PAST|nr:division/outer membrane stress-associated lipid-binding lipoprotein [Pasteurella canis]UAX42870.1 divisome-associated lipoprotein YraP [Pasteurella canis]UDW84455.1 divisome-associated lipoprotein YraP [Pasteurella canis]UEA17576.1 divisome-associated lipoprotein YraP [Pasteurella canis]SUC09762.1 putative transport-associated protein [Pasteurella canis]
MQMNTFKKLSIILASAILLQGCVAATIAGTAAVATKVATDPRTVGTQVDDETLEEKVRIAIYKDEQVKSEARINIVSYSGRILLIGQAPNSNLAEVATSLAKGVENVTEVYNQIRIQPQITFGQIAKDGIMTTEIKSKMLVDSRVKSTDIKVITENGEVFLMGNVTQAQAEAAADVSRNVSGVKKVVKVFNYLN